jgi:hypothetical protein
MTKSFFNPYTAAILSFVITFTLLMALVNPISAAPTIISNGKITEVTLSQDFIDALTSNDIEPAAIKPGKLKKGVASFPIIAAGVDTGEFPKSELFHSGGLSLTDSEGTTVQLFNFIIDILDPASPFLSGLVSAGDLVGRFDLFEIDLGAVDVENKKKNTIVSGAVLSLTDGAADTLNDAFGVDVFSEGDEVGVATLTLKVKAKDFE